MNYELCIKQGRSMKSIEIMLRLMSMRLSGFCVDLPSTRLFRRPYLENLKEFDITLRVG